MKAVIMAGGEGVRLRPLTCDIPKPMARLCGRPVIDYILDLLEKHACTRAAVTLRYLPERITEHFPDQRHGGISLSFVEEEQPLGTAGSVKNASVHPDFAFAPDSGENLLVISGDAMCDFDLSAALAFHRRHNADVTILAKRVADPREYGLLDAYQDGRIAGFIEKPAFSQAVSDLANTGIYILSPQALARIPADKPFDFARDLFPMMLAEGRKLMCLEEKGYWCDIGDLNSYIRCQKDILAQRVHCTPPGRRDSDGNIWVGTAPPRTVRLAPPVYWGHGARAEDGAVIENSVVDDGGFVGAGARVSGAVLLPGAYIGARAKLTGSLVGAGAAVKTGAMLFEASTAGAGAVIGESTVVQPGVRIWNQKEIPAGTVVSGHVKSAQPRRYLFEEDGIAGEIGVEITAEFLARLGSAVGSLAPKGRIAVGASEHLGTASLKDALCAGIQSTGMGVMDFGESFLARFAHDMNFAACPLGVFITGGSHAGVRVLTQGGLSSGRGCERRIEALLSGGEFTRCTHDRMGDRVLMKGMDALYKASLLRQAPQGLAGVSVWARSHSAAVQELLRDTLRQLGCEIAPTQEKPQNEDMQIEVSPRGDAVQAYSKSMGLLAPPAILSLCAISRMERGEDIALPFDAPRFLDAVAAEHQVTLHRYLHCPADDSDREARKLAAAQLWAGDGLMQTIQLLALVQKAGGWTELLAKYHVMAMASRTLETPGSATELMNRVSARKSGAIQEGVVYTHSKGVALIKPLKRGAGIRILAEAVNSETAEEICADIAALLREKPE